MTIDTRPTLQAPDDDPYIWLEDIDGTRAITWADAETAKTRATYLTASALADRDTLAALLDRPDKLPSISRRGAHLYNFWQDKQNPRGLWRRTSLNDFRTGSPSWDVLLDWDALAKAECEDWVAHGHNVLSGTFDRAIISLSRGGSDASVHREFDLNTRTFIADGFNLPEAKGHVTWWDRDTVLVASALGGPEFVTASGYARTVRLWRRGTDFAKAPVIFEAPASSVMVFPYVDRATAQPSLWVTERVAFFDATTSRVTLTGSSTKLDLPADAVHRTFGNWLFVIPRKPWVIGSETVATDQVVVFDLAAFERGDRAFTTLFEPTARSVMTSWCLTKGRITLQISDNLQPRFIAFDHRHGRWHSADVPALPSTGVVSLSTLDSTWDDSNGDLLITSEDPLTPPTLSLIETGTGAPQVLRQAPQNFTADGHIVRQLEATAPDGERIPYTITGPAGAPTGEAPVYMIGYGGFQVDQQPNYRTAIGKLWLERGGTSVTANIRGGGEFGVRWHEAGRREKKITSHDDFALVAADLVARGITTPKRIAAEGGSNGGILISNMLTRYPERFGALFCTIPLIDMRRYTKLLAGASWVAEYGDPDKPEEWAFLQKYSAYHAAKPGHAYPPILIATTRKDDRVHPGHARKFAAKLHAMGYTNAHYFESPTGGHGYGKDTTERATFTTLGLTFLARAINWHWHPTT